HVAQAYPTAAPPVAATRFPVRPYLPGLPRRTNRAQHRVHAWHHPHSRLAPKASLDERFPWPYGSLRLRLPRRHRTRRSVSPSSLSSERMLTVLPAPCLAPAPSADGPADAIGSRSSFDQWTAECRGEHRREYRDVRTDRLGVGGDP